MLRKLLRAMGLVIGTCAVLVGTVACAGDSPPRGERASTSKRPAPSSRGSNRSPQREEGVDALDNVAVDVDRYLPQPGAILPVPAAGWSGLRVLNQMASTVGQDYPIHGFELRALGVTFWNRAYSDEHQWIELLTVHDYSGGSTDETEDFLEIAAVQLPTGLHLGINVRVNDSVPEYDWYTPEPVLEFGVEYDIGARLDPATGIVAFSVDGADVGSGLLRHAFSEEAPAVPLRMTRPAPSVDLLIARGGVSVHSIEVTEHERGDVLISIDADDASDGDSLVTSGGRTFEGGGRVRLPFASPRLIGGPWSLASDDRWNLTEQDSATWILPSLHVWDGLDRFGGSAWWEWNFRDVIRSAAPGWGFGHIPGLVDFGFVISDEGSGSPFVVDGGSWPDAPSSLVVVLDRTLGELRLHRWAQDEGLGLLATTDVTELAAVVGDRPVTLFPDVAAADLASTPVFVGRALTEQEIDAILRRS